MKKWIILGMSVLSMLSLSAHTTSINYNFTLPYFQLNEITAVINKDTSEQELEDLKKFFSENGIELIIKKIKFNEKKEITGLSITLKKGNSKSQYSSSSNKPISEIDLGYKNNNLYITNSGKFDINAWQNQIGFNHANINIDSLMQKHNFSFNFDEDQDSLFFKGKFDIGQLKDQIMNSFSFEQNEDGTFSFNGHNLQPFTHQKKQRFSFTDHPDINKLIIIDGVESDFKTLDRLAKSDQLTEVDFLKSETAISIYGKKAKDGAIIATSKK